MKRAALLCSLILFAAAVHAQSVMPQSVREAVGVKSYPAAPRLHAASVAPAAILGKADASLIEEVHTWNAEGNFPMKNGFARTLHELVNVHLGAPAAMKGGPVAQSHGLVAATERGMVWSGTFRIDAYRVRLRLDNAKLPEGSVLWVYGDNDTPVAFTAAELLDDQSGLWTPSVRGGNVRLELEIPAPKNDAEAASFRVQQVMELVAPKQQLPKEEDDPSCLLDVTCVSSWSGLSSAQQGIAHLQYIKNGGGFVCTGGLLNDADQSNVVPYLLTANHCFSSQASATSLEAFWDYRFANCASTTIPDPDSFQRSNGATLLATGTASDFTLVRLNSIPSNRTLLGWNANSNAAPNGTTIYRVSHPAPAQFGPLPQMFSTTVVSTSFAGCTGRTRPNYIYSLDGVGGVYGGSSGSPVMLSNGQVVGQLFGSCGPSPADGCNDANSTVDGSLVTTFPQIQQYIFGSPVTPQPCTPSATTVCLGDNNRFAVSVTYRANNQPGSATAIEYTNDSGLFWFFSAANIEMLLKVLNACGLNNRFWIYAAATTDLEYTITVTDTQRGVTKTYFHAAGTPAPAITDSNALPCQ